MAGDWIKFEIGTSDKPEVWSIAQQLNIDPDAVVGKLLRVWGWFDQHTENGEAELTVKLMLDRKVGIVGFCDALIAAGWMAQSDTELIIPSFDAHNGSSAKKRLSTAKRVAEFKARKRSGNANGNAEETESVAENNAHETQRQSIPRPIRASIYKRDGHTCVYCGRKEGEYAPTETARCGLLSIDHVIPLTRNGANHPRNMVTACIACNQYKGDRTPEEAGLDWPVDEFGKRYQAVNESVTEPLPREEKRREDKNITTADAVVCAEQSCSPPPQGDQPKKSAPAKPAEPAVLELLTTRAGVLVPVTQTQIDQWADAYPAVDVMQSLRRIQSWLACNPKKRKTPAGMFRFVDSWLAREQDKPRVDPGGPPPGPQPGRQFLNSREKNAQRNAEIFDLERARQFGEPLCN